MPNVTCKEIYCKHNIHMDCTADNISVGDCANEQWGAWCSEYEDYTTGPDYCHEFWIAIRGPFRQRCTGGKKIIIDDIEFYTLNDDREPSECLLTHTRTGIACGVLERIPERIDQLKADIGKFPDVMTLPEKPPADRRCSYP